MRHLLLKTATIILLVFSFAAAGDIIMVPSTGIRTISQAIVRARAGDTIIVSDGVYREDIFLSTGIFLRAQNPHGAIIDGDGRGTVVTLASGSGIEGFEIRNGTVGIFSNAPDVTIRRNLIIRNWMTGMILIRHSPAVEDNIVAFNRGSGIVGWNVRAARGAIEHNTIAYNAGFGVHFGGDSDVTFQYNTIAFNHRFGLRINESSAGTSTIRHNNFWENLRQFTELPEGNYTFDPAFISPRVTYDFSPNPELCCGILTPAGLNLGVRPVARR